MSWGVSHLLALLTGFCLDLLLGDPHWAPHPVRAASVWAELGDLCLFRSRRKIRQAFFPS